MPRTMLPAAVLGVLLAAAAAPAEEPAAPPPASRSIGALRPWAGRRLDRAHAALAAHRIAEARAALGELARSEARLTATERALMHQTLGYVEAAEEHWEPAAAAFEQALADGGLPDADRRTMRRDLAQLYLALGRGDDAMRLLTACLAEEPPPAADLHYLAATAERLRGDTASALAHARAAVAGRPAPPESWLRLLLALLVDDARYREAVPITQRLLAAGPADPKPYWLQLSALYGALGERRHALAAMQAAHAAGLLTDERDLTTLAQLYLASGVPYRAALLLEDAMRAGTVPETPRSLALLAQSWLAAREPERARAPLARAAAAAEDGGLFLRLARLELDAGHWEAARAAARAALAKGGLARPGDAELLLRAADAGGAHEAPPASTAAAAGANVADHGRSTHKQ